MLMWSLVATNPKNLVLKIGEGICVILFLIQLAFYGYGGGYYTLYRLRALQIQEAKLQKLKIQKEKSYNQNILKKILEENEDDPNLLTDRAVRNGPKCIDSGRNARRDI